MGFIGLIYPLDFCHPNRVAATSYTQTSYDALMTPWITNFLTLAEEGGAIEPESTSPLILLAVLFSLFYFVILRPQSRERKKRKETLGGLKKNDRVVSIGGIIGTVADMSPDGDRVTLKVDDNTRIKMLRSAIQGPYEEPEAPQQ